LLFELATLALEEGVRRLELEKQKLLMQKRGQLREEEGEKVAYSFKECTFFNIV
jgi:hypothetical protein